MLAACGGKSDPFLDVGSAKDTDTPKVSPGETPKEIPKEAPKETPNEAPKDDGTTEWKPVDGVSKSSPIDGDPTLTVIERAFRNQRPAFPLISKDGDTAVVDVITRSNDKGWLTYTVEYLGANATTAAERIPLVDAPLMTLLGNERDASKIPMTEVKRITKAAKRINDRTVDEGFARFEGQIDKVGAKGSRAGDFAVVVKDEMVVKVAHTSKWQAETPKLEATPMPKVGSIECNAQPKLRRVFFDNGHKRVLVHIGWETGADQCTLPDDRYFFMGP
jgi:hypothetical protein